MNNSYTKISNLFYFEEIVQFPLDAIIRASANSNNTVLSFLDEFCFIMKDGKRISKKFIFYYDYISNGSVQQIRIEIPIISLVTIPYYTIDSAKFDMGINIVSSVDTHTSNRDEKKIIAMLGNQSPAVFTNNRDSLYSTVSTNMNVKIEVVPSDLPTGILQLINISSQCISSNTSPDENLNISEK